MMGFMNLMLNCFWQHSEGSTHDDQTSQAHASTSAHDSNFSRDNTTAESISTSVIDDCVLQELYKEVKKKVYNYKN